MDPSFPFRPLLDDPALFEAMTEHAVADWCHCPLDPLDPLDALDIRERAPRTLGFGARLRLVLRRVAGRSSIGTGVRGVRPSTPLAALLERAPLAVPELAGLERTVPLIMASDMIARDMIARAGGGGPAPKTVDGGDEATSSR